MGRLSSSSTPGDDARGNFQMHSELNELTRDSDSVDGISVLSLNLSEYDPESNSHSFNTRPNASSAGDGVIKPVQHSNWFFRLLISCTGYIQQHWAALIASGFLCLVLSAASLGLSNAYFSGLESEAAQNALELAMESGRYFGDELDRATMPLLSLAQFVSEVESFQRLSNDIGAPNETGSLPYISATHRNLTGSLCNDPAMMERYDHIAETIAKNSRMEDVLMLLGLAPYGVVCMLNPHIDSNDYSEDHPLNSSYLLGLDYLSEPMRWRAEYTLKHNGQMTMSGPKRLTIPCLDKVDSRRGGGCRYHGYSASVLEASLPIRVPGYTMQISSDGRTSEEASPYWGFAITTIHLEALIEKSGAFQKFADQELDFQLTRKVTLGGSGQAGSDPPFVILAESPGFSTENRVVHSTEVALDPYLPGESWTITVSYATTAPWHVWVIPLVVIMCFCVSFLVFKILLQKQDSMDMAAAAMAQESKVQTERNMTAYFAHELRNPLSAMDSALKAMPEEDVSGPGKELLAGMRICSDFMSTIMNNLLDVRKMEEGELTLKRMPVNLDLLVESLHRMFQPNVRPGVEFVWRSDISSRDRKWVIGDSHRLQQIFANVITNALKYTTSGSVTLSIGWEDEYLSASEGSQQTRTTTESTTTRDMTEDHADETVTSRTMTSSACPVSTIDFSGEIRASEVAQEIKIGEIEDQQWSAPPKPKGIMKVPKSTPLTLDPNKQEDTMPSRIRFECADTGPGILKSHQSELFKKFVQRGGAPGTGLGLAISKHLVELMGGEIFYESDPTTRPGSTCIVLLPLPPCHAPPKSKAEKRQQEAEEEKYDPLQDEISILIVDDIKMNRMMLKRRFQKGVAPNCTITEAPNGETALEILERESFDVVIVDQFMEDAGGVLLGTDTILAMRRQGISSLVIGCSGNDIEKDFLEAGADHCWQKPLPDNGTIIRQFRKHMDRSFRRQKAES